MEPIRPDEDELRAERPTGSAEPAKAAARAPGKEKGRAGGGNGRGGAVLWLLVIAVAVAAAVGWYSQHRQIQALESQLEEADYWARQSKLALARFQGELSETGENLQERGASLSDQLAEQKQLLETANSEIRKLWAIANERNKQRLDQHQERIAAVEAGLAEDDKALAALEASVEKARSTLSTDLEALKGQTETSISALQAANSEATGQLTRLTQKMAEVDQVVESRIRRFEQEQKLGIDGLESRVSALEKETDSLAGDGRLRALQGELASLKQTVESIDASRSQLTSRLIRLSEEVNQLRSRVSGQ